VAHPGLSRSAMNFCSSSSLRTYWWYGFFPLPLSFGRLARKIGLPSGDKMSKVFIVFPTPQERKRRIWPNPAQSSPLPRHLVVEFAAERGVRHCRVCLGCFAGAFKGGRLDPADPRVSMLEAADAKLDDGIVVRLYPLHSSAV